MAHNRCPQCLQTMDCSFEDSAFLVTALRVLSTGLIKRPTGMMSVCVGLGLCEIWVVMTFIHALTQTSLEKLKISRHDPTTKEGIG